MQNRAGPYVSPYNQSQPSDPGSTIAKDSRKGVNDLLHTMRGEQFRRAQNIRRSRAHLSSAYRQNSPSLPFDFVYGSLGNTEADDQASSALPSSRPVAGPEPPKSWTNALSQRDTLYRETPAWRAEALSLVLSRHPSYSATTESILGSQSASTSVTPLIVSCFRVLLSEYDDTEDFVEELVPSLPPHLCRELLRYTAIHCPLSNAKLYGLLEPEGHADGEMIVVGPEASLRNDHLRRLQDTGGTDEGTHEVPLKDSEVDEEWSWDSPTAHDQSSSPPLNTLLLLSVSLSTPTRLPLPPTLTHLALLDLSTPVPLHRLPNKCPLLVVLDLSFNDWVRDRNKSMIEKVDWKRWRALEVLGLRGCGIGADLVSKVNDGRWTDVEVIMDTSLGLD